MYNAITLPSTFILSWTFWGQLLPLNLEFKFGWNEKRKKKKHFCWVLPPLTFSTILYFPTTEVVNHNSRTWINLTLTWLYLCPPMPDQLSKPVQVGIWQISVLHAWRVHPTGSILLVREQITELQPQLHLIHYKLWVLHYICGPSKEAAEHQNKASEILKKPCYQ